MTIDWAALATVAVVSLGVGVLVVVLVSLALVGLSARETADGEPVRRLSPAAGVAVAVLCLGAAAAIVLYGFALLVF